MLGHENKRFSREILSFEAELNQVLRYERTEVLSSNGLRETSIVRDNRENNKRKIMKKISLHNDPKPEQTRQEAEYVIKFKHGNIVKGLDKFECVIEGEPLLFIVTEFCEVFIYELSKTKPRLVVFKFFPFKNGDLMRVLERHAHEGTRPGGFLVWSWLSQLAEALDFIHNEKRIAHRDLKSRNVFLEDGYQRVKLGDFGLSRPIIMNYQTTQKGTLNYMSPERLNDVSGVNPKSDCWSFGCILYEMMALKQAFPDPVFTDDIIRKPPPRLNSPDYDNLYSKLMRKDVNTRIDSHQLKQELKDIGSRIVLSSRNFKDFLERRRCEKRYEPFKCIDPALFSDDFPFRERLDLSRNHIESLEPYTFGSLSKTLAELDLSFNQLTTIDMVTFISLTRLERLNLESNHLSKLPNNALFDLRSLKFVNFCHNDIATIDESVFSNLVNLIELNLENNRIRELDPMLFSGLNKLTILNLSKNQLESVNGRLFADLSSLTSLYLNNNELRTIERSSFANLASLRVLDLSNNRLSALSLELTKLSSLEELNLGSNRLREIAVDDLACLSSLRVLDLRDNDLRHISPRFIATLARLERLVILGNRVANSAEIETVLLSRRLEK